jgi:hypothetical protein
VIFLNLNFPNSSSDVEKMVEKYEKAERQSQSRSVTSFESLMSETTFSFILVCHVYVYIYIYIHDALPCELSRI